MTDVDKSQVRAAFDRAATVYEATALFQRQVGERLAHALPALAPTRILDGGCGTGYCAGLLRQRWPEALLVGCDLSAAMATQAAARGMASVCGDLEHLPFADGSFDLVWSNLALQWCQPALAYAELQRVLSPGGLLVFSTLGPGTLHELENAFAPTDTHRRVLPFASPGQIEAELGAAGFAHIHLTVEPWVTQHQDLKTLLSTIRDIGAGHVGGNRRQGLMGKQAWHAAQARYDALRSAEGLLPATYVVVLGQARKPR